MGRGSEAEAGLKDSIVDAAEKEERIVHAEGSLLWPSLWNEIRRPLEKRMFSLQVCYKYLKWKIWIMSNAVEEHSTESWVYAWTWVWEGRQLSREPAIGRLSWREVTGQIDGADAVGGMAKAAGLSTSCYAPSSELMKAGTIYYVWNATRRRTFPLAPITF